jgi:hypothetical protein
MRILLVVAMVLLAPVDATAQRMVPLVEIPNSSPHSYPAVRCAALYHGVMEWVGNGGMEEENWYAMYQARDLMVRFSTLVLNEETGGTLEGSFEATVEEVYQIADRYILRLKRNFALTGQAFGQDAVIEKDLKFCDYVLEALRTLELD